MRMGINFHFIMQEFETRVTFLNKVSGLVRWPALDVVFDPTGFWTSATGSPDKQNMRKKSKIRT